MQGQQQQQVIIIEDIDVLTIDKMSGNKGHKAGELKQMIKERKKRNSDMALLLETHNDPTITQVRKVQRHLARVLVNPRHGCGYAWLVEEWEAYKTRVKGGQGHTNPAAPDQPEWKENANALELSKYKINLDYYNDAAFWWMEVIVLLEDLFPGQFSTLKEDGKLQEHVIGREMMDHLIASVLSVKEKGENYAAISAEITNLKYTPAAVGSANFFEEQHRLRQAAKELGNKLPDSHFMTLATNAFQNCGHTKVLMSSIHMEWVNKNSSDYEEFHEF